MEVALARSHRHLHADEPAGRDAEGGQAGAKEARVEDDAGVRGPVLLPEEVDDRVAPDLLLAVAGDADVDRQCALRCEVGGGSQEQVQLTLVVRDPAGVGPPVADGELERVALPELERRRRLHVEVAVREHGRRVRRAARRAQLAERQVPVADRRQLAGSAGGADEVAYPLAATANVVLMRRVGADARDAQKLRELVAPGLVHAAESRRGTKIDSRARVFDRWVDEEGAGTARRDSTGPRRSRLRRHSAPRADGWRVQPATGDDCARRGDRRSRGGDARAGTPPGLDPTVPPRRAQGLAASPGSGDRPAGSRGVPARVPRGEREARAVRASNS